MSENQNQLILLKDLGMIYATEKSKQKKRFGIYKCGYCGNEFKSCIANIKNNHTQSCGCHQKKMASTKNKKHGFTKTRFYRSWADMRKRVLNINNVAYNNYGGRGIKICDRWLKFENFMEDMYPTYKKDLTLDRINVNGNYEPSNCRWATIYTQARNTKEIRVNNTSGFRGVSFDKKSGKFLCQIGVNKKNKHIGRFNKATEAAYAYNNYVIENNLEHTINNVNFENIGE